MTEQRKLLADRRLCSMVTTLIISGYSLKDIEAVWLDKALTLKGERKNAAR